MGATTSAFQDLQHNDLGESLQELESTWSSNRLMLSALQKSSTAEFARNQDKPLKDTKVIDAQMDALNTLRDLKTSAKSREVEIGRAHV